MIVFELLINGRPVAQAGADDLSVLAYTLTARGVLGASSPGTADLADGVRLESGLTGLAPRPVGPDGGHRRWHEARLGIGDEVTLRIVARDDLAAAPVDAGA